MRTEIDRHIAIRPDGMAMIAGTQTKVIEVVLDRLAHHWDADEIHRQHPHLSLGQIYSALAYYYDHQAALDAVIEERLRVEDELFERIGDSPTSVKLKRIKATRRRQP